MPETLLLLLLTSLACGLLGVFLILRSLSMVADAISHAVLLGIVIAYLITREVRSSSLFIAAVLFGCLTVYLIETLIKRFSLAEDAAVGMVFPALFSLGIMLLSRFARNAHICVDTVMMGEPFLSTFIKTNVFGIEIPTSVLRMSMVLLVNVVFLALFSKELAFSTFDPTAAALAGFSLSFLHYALMSLVSVSSVMAFDAVGSILVISFLVAPGATALLFSRRLGRAYLLTCLIATLNCVIGYYLAIRLNVSLSGMIASTAGVVYGICLLVAPSGLIFKWRRRHAQRRELRDMLVLLHLHFHYERERERYAAEAGRATMAEHLDWPESKLRQTVERLVRRGYISVESDVYALTERGHEAAAELELAYYGLSMDDAEPDVTPAGHRQC